MSEDEREMAQHGGRAVRIQLHDRVFSGEREKLCEGGGEYVGGALRV